MLPKLLDDDIHEKSKLMQLIYKRSLVKIDIDEQFLALNLLWKCKKNQCGIKTAVLSRMKWTKICILSVIVTLIDLFPNWRIRTVWFLNRLSDKMVVRSIENICFCLASFIRTKVRRTKKSLQPFPKDLIKLAKMTENILLCV